MNNSTTICIDLAKEVFQVAVFNQAGKAKLNKEVTAKKMCLIIAQYPDAVIYMEACSSAHHWARRFTSSGHKVGLIPPHLAAKYRVGNKSDKNDVLSIYEASKNQQLHCVQIRTLEQQDIATLHKFREGYKKERNQIANRLRGFGREYGVNFALGITKLLKQVPMALEDAENEMTVVARRVVFRLLEQLRHVILLMKEVSDEIEEIAKQIDACQRLVQLPGIGWLGASMIYAKFGSAMCFTRGRDASASIGLVPAHSGSGGKVTIGRITKRGDTYLRTLIINGARSLVIHVKEKTDSLSCWVRQLLSTKGFNKTIVAVANKLVRMATAMLKSGLEYRQPVAQ